MSAAGDAFAQAVKRALQEHGPAMDDAREPVQVVHRLLVGLVEACCGPGTAAEYFSTAAAMERELDAARKRQSS